MNAMLTAPPTLAFVRRRTLAPAIRRPTTMTCDVLVVGLAFGALIADSLARAGLYVVGIDRDDGRASTLTNQKWKHSGALYLSEPLASRLSAAHRRMPRRERAHLLSRGAHYLASDLAALGRHEHTCTRANITHRLLDPAEASAYASFRAPEITCGLYTSDAVVDYPALIQQARASAEASGAFIMRGAVVDRLLRTERGVTGALATVGQTALVVRARHVIVAAGAWASGLAADVGARLEIQNWKSQILDVPTKVVSHIVAFVDQPHLTLVPYKGRTLISDSGRVPVQDPMDRDVDTQLTQELLAKLHDHFPLLRDALVDGSVIRACLKTERPETTRPTPRVSVRSTSAEHGVLGVTFVFPVKASLMCSEAQRIARRLQRMLRVSR